MSKRETVPVYVEGKFVRHVTPKQHHKEVAGKVLPRRPNGTGKGRDGKACEIRYDRICDRGGPPWAKGWNCYYQAVPLD